MYPVWPLSSAGFFRSLPHRSTFYQPAASAGWFCCAGAELRRQDSLRDRAFLGSSEHFEKLFPMAHPLTDEIMLELCFAIILPALAARLLFFENASGGGTDIIAMIIKKYSTMNISTALLVTDLIVVILAFLIFDTLTGLCSVLGLMAKTLLIDKTIERMKLNKFLRLSPTIRSRSAISSQRISITAQPFTTPSALTPTSSGQSFSRLWMSSRPSIFSGLFMIPSRPRLLRSQRAAKLSEKAS